MVTVIWCKGVAEEGCFTRAGELGDKGDSRAGRAVPSPTRVQSHPTQAGPVTLSRVSRQSGDCQTSLQGCNRSKVTQGFRSVDLVQEDTWPGYIAAT